MARKRWSELTTRQRSLVVALVAVQAVLATIAQRDLSSRAQFQVRGPKLLWRIATLNSVGAVLYLLAGRKR